MSTEVTEAVEPDALSVMPRELPLMPVRDLVVFPYMVVPLFVSRAVSLKAVEAAVGAEKLVFLCAQTAAGADVPGPNDLYRVGCVGKVLRAREMPDGQWKVLVQGLRRARAEELTFDDALIRARLVALDDPPVAPGDPLIESRVRALRDGLGRLTEAGRSLPADVLAVLLELDEPGALADLVAANLGLKVADAQLILEASEIGARLAQVARALDKEVEVVALKNRIQTQAKEEMSRTQREYFLREQLKQIRQELGELEDRQSDIDELRRRLDAARMPEEAAREALRQVTRLEQMNAESSEAALVRTHLDWMADLPWSREVATDLDLSRAQVILDEDHHGLDKLKTRILEYLGVLKLKKDSRGPVLCFVGPPGVGKTSLGRSIARSLGRPFVRISLGGVRDEAEIRGHRRTYVGAMPGRIIAALKQADAKNPVILLDELDKLGGSEGRGDPAAALLEVLDPEQNKSFRDHYLNVAFDLSKVLWVATANLVDTIPAALRDRMEVTPVPGYHQGEKLEILRRFLLPRQIDACGLAPADLTFTHKALEVLVEQYTHEAGVRDLERQLAAIARKVARRFAEGDDRAVRITERRLAELLGPPRPLERLEESDTVGVATGLAWTEAGGAILHVEATLMSGRPQLTLTGQLGKVMKESAQAALSLARSKAARYGIGDAVFNDHELHVHVPQGAIPKDGPSAGVTIATALVSLLTGCPVRRDVAMTGEITLRGRVLPVGGVREKILAAARSGITTVILPAANEADLAELPPEARRKIHVHLARDIEDVLGAALVGFSPRVPGEVSGEASRVPVGPVLPT